MLQAHLEEETRATVSGTARLRGIDSIIGDPECDMSSRSILFDPGTHFSVIVEDLLFDQFREYLRSPQNDPYQSEDRTRVQADCTFLFSNHLFEISTIFEVVPRRAAPNGRVGIIIGQKGLLNRKSYRSVPREILKARGNHVEEGIRGDIVIEEHLNFR
ncbi:uracil DNA glycosylase [Lobaria immixta]|nr:uracil DNA glycosylase [Lobaria immixta]